MLSVHTRFCLLVLSFTIGMGAHAQQLSEQEPDSYTETGVNPFQTQISDAPNETVDPYSGLVQLSQQDIYIPGNAGLDIVVNRSYTSRKRFLLADLGGPLGSGWNFHFGRLSGSDLDVCLENGDSEPLTTNNVSIEMNSGSKDLLVKSTIPGVSGLISKNNLRVQCSDTVEEDNFILTPDGTKYSHRRIGQFAVVTRIEDVHGNWIRIEYDQQGHPVELYRKEESDESIASSGSEVPVLTFQYKTESVRVNAGTENRNLLESITFGNKIWQYNVEKVVNPSTEFLEEFYLAEVIRPDEKKWQFDYFPNDVEILTTSTGQSVISHLDSSHGAGSVKRITYPDGGLIDYTYQAVNFRKNATHVNYFVVQTKTLTDPISNQTATWTYQFAPGSDPTYPGANTHDGPNGTVTLNNPLALDVTTVTSPYGIVKYRHFGSDVSTYTAQTSGSGSQDVIVFWPRALMGLLARKEVYSSTGSLIEARVYDWDFRPISDEQYTPGDRFETATGQPVAIQDGSTRAPILLSESLTYDLQWSGLQYGQTTYEAYDVFGNPTRIRESGNPQGKADTIIEYEYENNIEKWIIGLPTRKTSKLEGSAKEAVTTNEYDMQTGNLLKRTNLGITVDYTYYPNGELETITDANGVITRFEDYVRGIPTKQTNGAGNFPLAENAILPETIIDAENTILRTVNPTGTIASITDGNGNETKYTYDVYDRITLIDYPKNLDSTIEYTNVGNSGGSTEVCLDCATRTYSRGQYSRTDFFDGFGRLIGSFERNNGAAGASASRVFKTRYDLLGRTVFESLPSSDDGISYEYDALNRVVKTTNPDNTFSSITYIQSIIVRTTDELGNIIERLYDDSGSTVPYSNLRQELRFGADGVGTQYDRDVLGNVVSTFHGDFKNGGLSGFWRNYEYNDKFQLIREDNSDVSDPDKEYTYDPAGNLKTSTVIAGIGPNTVRTYQYDSLYQVNNILSSDTNTPTLSYEYDDNGNVVKTVNDIVEKSYQYDVNDNLTVEQLAIGAPYNQNFAHSYTYNTLDQIASVEYPSGLVVDLNPDVLGRQTKAGIFADNVQYFPSSHLKSYTLGNNKTVNIDLDQRLFVKRINTNNLIDLTYSYDSVGNVTSIVDALDNARNVTIPNDGYDAVYRLRKATGPWGDVEYEYSDGRPMDFARRILNGQIQVYGYDGNQNNLLTEYYPTNDANFSYRYTYDSLGNIAKRTKRRLTLFPFPRENVLQETFFNFDAHSRLRNASGKQYLYDAGGMRVAEVGPGSIDRKFSFYNQAEELVFELDNRKCLTSDYIRIESTQIAKSDDTFELDSDGDQLSDCHEQNIGNDINDPADGDVDTDGDGLEDRYEINVIKTDPYDRDSDDDGVNDGQDAYPNDPSRSVSDVDTDGDGVPDALDAFPNDPTETVDTDGDGVGDNSDVFPNDPNESADTDGDGVGDNADAFPNDPTETRDSDGDGVGDVADEFPNDPTRTITDTDADGVADRVDAFPNDPTESADSDGDGIGDNTDPQQDYSYLFTADNASDYFGRSVSYAGDVNNDGYGDIIVGAMKDDDNGHDAGSARVYSGADGSVLYTFQGERARAYFGISVSDAGDVNNDGFDDVVVGSVFYGGTGGSIDDGIGGGSAYVYSGADGTLLYQFSDDAGVRNHFGQSVSGAGDVNNDGYDDIIVGAQRTSVGGNTFTGSAFVYSGIDGQLLYRFNGRHRTYYGSTVSDAGDVNNDGYDDVLIAAYRDKTVDYVPNGGIGSGGVEVRSGQDGALLYHLYPEVEADGYADALHFGGSISSAGDVNNDGHDDIIVSELGFDGKADAARLYSGIDGSLLRTFNMVIASANQSMIAVSGVGDVDGDGYDDVLIGATALFVRGNYSGSARVYSGRNGQILHQSNGGKANDLYGIAVGGGDINGDGLSDIVVGAHNSTEGLYFDISFPFPRPKYYSSGYVRVISPFTDTDGDGVHDGIDAFPNDPNESKDSDRDGVGDNADAFPNDPTETSDRDGDGVGDNRDAYPDDPTRSEFDSDGDGVVDSEDAFPDDPSETLDSDADGIGDNTDSFNNTAFVVNHEIADRFFVADAAGMGDINNDGYDDIFILKSEAADLLGGNTDDIYTYSGQDGSLIYQVTVVADEGRDFPGTTAQNAGDVNNDGVDDIILGSGGEIVGSIVLGSVRVLSGVDGSLLHRINGQLDYGYFGENVGSAGDVNDDGYDDFLVSESPGENDNQFPSVYVFSGQDGTQLHQFVFDQYYLYPSFSPNQLGDVNGDGHDDIIIGNAGFTDNAGDTIGNVRVYSGADGSVLFDFDGTDPIASFGLNVSGIGDVDQDGRADFLIGQYQVDGATVSPSVGLYSGNNGSLLRTFVGEEPSGNPLIKRYFTLNHAGDVNNDQVPDIVIGSGLPVENFRHDPHLGYVQVFSSDDASTIATFRRRNVDDFGMLVASAGDANGDGADEILVGSRDDTAQRIEVIYVLDNLLSNDTVSDLLAPASGSVFTSAQQTFQWEDIGADEYRIHIGTTPGGLDIREMVGPGSFLQATIDNLPVDGSTIYVTVIALKNNVYTRSPDYSFTSHTETGLVSEMISPVPGAILPGNEVTFRWEDVGAENHAINVGTTPGGSQIFASYIPGLERRVTNLPIDGSTVYVRLSTLKDGTWRSKDYEYTSLTGTNLVSNMISPAPGSTLPGNEVTFRWEDVGADNHAINVGTTPGGSQIFASYIPGLERRVTNLPVDGSTVYVRLSTFKYGTWRSQDYEYTSLSGTNLVSNMISPASGSILPGNEVTFRWEDVGADNHAINVGTTPGGSQIFASYIPGLERRVTNLPVDGSTVYVRLSTLKYGTWRSQDYEYTSLTGTNLVSNMISPAPGSTLPGNEVTFRWEDVGADNHAINVGTTPGGSQIFASYIPGLERRVTNLPVDGSTVYVRLSTLKYGTWRSQDYEYTSLTGTNLLSNMISPAPGSTLPANEVTFRWEDVGADNHAINVGTTPGGSQIFASYIPGLERRVANLPVDGSTVYVRLSTFKYGTWRSQDYEYTSLSGTNLVSNMISPAPGSILPGNEVTFRWEDVGADNHAINVGTTPGGSQIFASYIPGLERRVTNLPVDGSTVYVRLSTLKYGTWRSQDYEYTSLTGLNLVSNMLSPTPGSTLTGNIATFRWEDVGADNHAINVGTTPGGSQIFASYIPGLERRVINLPADGSTIYVRLSTLKYGTWRSQDYQFISQ